MTGQGEVIVQVTRGGAVDRKLSADPPSSVANGHVVVDHIAGEPGGTLGPPDAGMVVLSVLSPEALSRDRQQVSDVIRRAPAAGEPLVILVQAAEELREDELAVVLDAAVRAHRQVIVRVLADAWPGNRARPG